MSFERAYYACKNGNCPNCMEALEEERNYNTIMGIYLWNIDKVSLLNEILFLANNALNACFKCRKEIRPNMAVVKLLEERLPDRFKPEEAK